MNPQEEVTEVETDWTFEDWYHAGVQYAESLGYPEQGCAQFGSDLAWYHEGMTISEVTMEKAYSYWITGENYYSPHSITLEGYDYEEHAQRNHREQMVYAQSYAEKVFPDDPANIEKFLAMFTIDGTYSEGITTEGLDLMYEEYTKGAIKGSPYYIPLEDENIKERAERIEVLAKVTTLSGMMFGLMYRSTYKEYCSLTLDACE